MRYTYGTIAAVTCAILVLATFWPDPEGPVMQNVVAQSQAKDESSTSGVDLPAEVKTYDGDATDPFAGSREKIEAKLSKPCEAEFFQMPLRGVLADLSEQLEITILFDPLELGGDRIDPDVPVDVQVGPDTMSGKTLLGDFILAPNGLVYTIRDNFLMITSYDKSLTKYEVVAYDCRDLLVKDGGIVTADVVSERFEGNYESASEAETDATTDKAPFYFGGPAPPPATPEQRLMRVIQLAVRSEDAPWDDGSGATTSDENVGTMSVINGLLVVRQTRAVHERVEQLLEVLRKGIQERDPSPTANH